MKLKKLQIHNWRSIKDVEIYFQNLMVFVGQNNHGKSNVLSAILFFFGTTTCTDPDFNKDSEEAFVEITFDSLDDQDKSRFAKYLAADETFAVRRQITKGETAEYHGYLDIPQDEWLKEENIGNYISHESISATPLGTLVPATGRITKEIVRQAQDDYISANRAGIIFSRALETGNFLGSKTLPQGIFGDVFFVPAVKNAADDLNPKGKSPFNSLLTNVINEMSSSNAAYIAVKEQIRTLMTTLSKKLVDGSNNTERPEQISRLEELLESELATWNTKIDIDIAAPDVDEALKLGTNVVVDDGVRTDINRKGNGLQRSLIFALIKSWAKISQEKKVRNDGEEGMVSKSTYFIFEEPELYLHPQAQRELFSSLKKLSEIESQVFLSTHSSSFVDLGRSESICVVYKKSLEEGTKCLQCTKKLFEDLAEEKKFNLTYWINPDRGELFFARKVILVEGQTEKTVIPWLAKHKADILKYDYTIIDCGGKDNLPLFIRLLNNFKLPYVVVYDRDHQVNKLPADIVTSDALNTRIEETVDATYGSTVIFENDIEEEIGLAGTNRSKAYRALEHISEDGFICPDPLRDKIGAIYS